MPKSKKTIWNKTEQIWDIQMLWGRKIKCWGSSETRLGKVSWRSEPISRGKRPFKVPRKVYRWGSPSTSPLTIQNRNPRISRPRYTRLGQDTSVIILCVLAATMVVLRTRKLFCWRAVITTGFTLKILTSSRFFLTENVVSHSKRFRYWSTSFRTCLVCLLEKDSYGSLESLVKSKNVWVAAYHNFMLTRIV